ncbi:MAG: hypothetical protein FWE83_08800 [Oscillospiraceae bacterium]|nr:hypothetical protein [Oscillospiraceae bacterium]
MNEEFDVIWRRGDGEMPKKAEHVVNAASEDKLLRSLRLSIDAENTIRHNASKSNKTVCEYISALVMTSLQPI